MHVDVGMNLNRQLQSEAQNSLVTSKTQDHEYCQSLSTTNRENLQGYLVVLSREQSAVVMDEDIAAFLAEEEAADEDMLCSFLDPEKENGEPNLSDSDVNQASWARPLISNPITGAQDLGGLRVDF
jgi:hypothetical protein